MFAPARAVYSLRPKASPLVAAAASVVAALFVATPFLVPEVSRRYGVSLGLAGLISVSQVLAFAVANFVAGRTAVPTRRMLLVGVGLAVVANAASAAISLFWLLVVVRMVAGVGAGILTWTAWSDAMSGREAMRSVAATGPVVAIVGAPLFGWLAGIGDDRLIYGVLAAISLVAGVIPGSLEVQRRARSRMSPSRSNLVLIAGLGILLLAGSALLVFSVALAEELTDMTPLVISGAFSANAVAGLVGTRIHPPRGTGWIWLLGTAAGAGLIAFPPTPLTFYLGMMVWGFSYWVAVPLVLASVASWSLAPDERVGDAQGVMAVGRALGPAAGGVFAASSYAALGVFAVSGLAAAAAIVGSVEFYRRRRISPAASVR